MAEILASHVHPNFRQAVGREVMEQSVRSAVVVLRPLDTPATIDKLGAMLSHSACILTTEDEAFVIVEYMWGGKIYISLCPTYEPGSQFFKFRHYDFTHIDIHPQTPNRAVTVRQFAMRMDEFMRDKPFSISTHNCHNACYLTMRNYGMRTRNPEAGQRNQFYQGFIDYYTAGPPGPPPRDEE
jgi:hypothetical protein